MEHYTLLLEKEQEGTLTEAEQLELAQLHHKADLFMLQKAQATVLLRWRGERLGADQAIVSTYLPESLPLQIETADRQRCCYCLTMGKQWLASSDRDIVIPTQCRIIRHG